MKKGIVIIISAVLLTAICACAGKKSEENANADGNASAGANTNTEAEMQVFENNEIVPAGYYSAVSEKYADHLEKLDERYRFGLYDVDNNGEKELLLAQNDSHADAVTILKYDSEKDRLADMGSYGSYGEIHGYSEIGIIMSGYTGQGVSESQMVDVTGLAPVVIKTMTNKSVMTDEESGEWQEEYYIDGERVDVDLYYDAFLECEKGVEFYYSYKAMQPKGSYAENIDYIESRL